MAEKKIASVSSLSKGSYVILDGVACRVTGLTVSRPGKHGHAKVRLEATGILDGKKKVTVMPGHDSCEVPIINKLTAQVLSVHGNQASVMDSESFETFDMEIPDELKEDCKEGSIALYWDILGTRVMKQIKGEGE